MDVLENPLTRERQRHERELVSRVLNLPAADSNPHTLVLSRYVSRCPWRFFDPQVEQQMTAFLHRQQSDAPDQLAALLTESRQSVETAYSTLQQLNQDVRVDGRLERNDMDALRLCCEFSHPTYGKLCEPVVNALLHPVAVVARMQRGKSTNVDKLAHVLEEAKRMGLVSISDTCSSKLRNAIVHGSFVISQGECCYRDNKWGRTLRFSEMAEATDALLAAANGLALAYERHWLNAVASGDDDRVPVAFLSESIGVLSESPNWAVSGVLQSVTIQGESQLNVFARSTHRDQARLAHDVTQTALVARKVAPRTGRIFVNVQNEGSTAAFGSFGADSLDRVEAHLRNPVDGSEPEQQAGEGDGIQFLSGRRFPSAMRRAGILADAFIAQGQALRTRRCAASPWFKPDVRTYEAFTKRGLLAVRATVVTPVWSDLPEYAQFVRRVPKLVRSVVNAVRGKSWAAPHIAVRLVGFVEVCVFTADHSRRRLDNYGLGADFLCRLTKCRIPIRLGA